MRLSLLRSQGVLVTLLYTRKRDILKRCGLPFSVFSLWAWTDCVFEGIGALRVCNH